MLRDPYGQEISTSDAEVQSGVEDFILGFLSNETRISGLLRIPDPAAGRCAVAQAYAAALMLMQESDQAVTLAQPFMQKARSAAGTATAREQLVVAAVDAWYHNDIPKALALGEHLADEYPAELVMAKITQVHYFNLGNAAGMLRIAAKVSSFHPENPHVYGMLAFGYEQCHLLEQAEAAAMQALDLKAREPWAQHALAHVYLTRGETDRGIQFLEGVSSTWQDLNSFMYTHNWWHLCLLYLNRDRFDEVLACYDAHLWGIEPEFSQDQIGAVSMLTRLEHFGVDVAERWQTLGEYLKSRVQDHVNPFLDLQYIYGLARAGLSEADDMLQQLEQYAQKAPDFERARWMETALPTARGLIAHARGQWSDAAGRLQSTLPDLHRLGGSHAQRSLFGLVLLDARVKAEDWVNAQQALELLRQYDDKVPNTWRLLVKAYQALDLPRESARAETALGQLMQSA